MCTMNEGPQITEGGDDLRKQSDHNNRSNQMNPNNDAYWQARGWDNRPEDWKERSHQEEDFSKSRIGLQTKQ